MLSIKKIFQIIGFILKACIAEAFYNSNTVEIKYNSYDADRVLLDSYCAVFGGES